MKSILEIKRSQEMKWAEFLLGKHNMGLQEANLNQHQKLVSQLELLDEKLSQEDVIKSYRSLPPEWGGNTHASVWRIIPKWSATTATRGDILLGNVELQEIKTTRTRKAKEGLCLWKTTNSQLWCLCDVVDYEEIDRGYVAFGGNPKGRKITGKGTIKTARTPQQNGVAKRRNRTLIEAARTMLVDSKLPTTFWAEAVNTACYVQNRVLVVKPYDKTLYKLFHGRTPTLSFMRPFGCPVTILNTIDHLGKFEGKVDEGFFVRYSLNSKAFKIFNSRTRIVEENLHIRFSESTPNVVGSGLDWLFDIDALTRTINYEPISSHDDESKPSSDDGKKVDENSREDSECKDQEKEDNVNSTNNVNVAGTNEVNVVGGKTSIELPFDPNMHALEDYSIFETSRDDEDDDVEADMNNLDTTIKVSPNPTTRIHKDHPLEQVIGDLQ
ncbi:retrovirus-related pol polyprotein from transposon TNT 1-94 [Tanacetum coccineum]